MKKYLILISFLAVFLMPNFSSAQTVEELKIQIAQLLKQIEELRTKLAEKESASPVWCYDFNSNLKIGDSGSDIEALKTVLQKEGFDFKNGGEKFDDEVASVVSGFQQKYGDEILAPLGLKYGTGYLGKATRAKLNQLYGCGVVLPAKSVSVSPQTATAISISESCKVSAMCASGYTLYNTGEKDGNNCSIKKCIPIGSQPEIWGSGPGSLQVGETGNFTITARDQKQQPLIYSANWGDGASSSYSPDFYTETANFSHSYNKAGVYNFSFIVTDNKGLSAKTGSSVKVTEATTAVPLSISGADYRNVYWQCYDGKESYEGGETSCKNSKIWKQYAEDFCMGRCRYDGKCGVNAFKFWNECGLIPTPAPTPMPTIPAQTMPTPAPASTFATTSTAVTSPVPIQEIYEQVKCVFKGTAVKQECYGYASVSGYNYGCSGIETCVFDVKGAKNEQVTWKSSCGGYAYTVTDGINEYAEFECPALAPTLITPVTPFITVLSPNGGEVFRLGATNYIKWLMPNDQPYHIEFYLMPQGQTPVKLASSTSGVSDVAIIPAVGGYGIGGQIWNYPGSQGSFTWTISSIYPEHPEIFPYPEGTYKIRAYLLPKDVNYFDLSKVIAQDESDAEFTIVAATPYINILSPNYNGEEKWLIGNSYSIKWETPGYSQSLIARIILFSDKTGSEETIADVGNTGLYVWTIPAVLGNIKLGEGFIYKIRVELLSIDSSKRIYGDSNVGHLGIF